MKKAAEIEVMLLNIFPNMREYAEIGYAPNDNPIYLIWEREQYYIVTYLHKGIRLVCQSACSGDFDETKELLLNMSDVMAGCTEYKILAAEPAVNRREDAS